MELVLQELIEAEATEAIGAGRYERRDVRTTQRNGHQPRLLATQAGDVEVKIPKLRRGSFFSSVLEPRRRIDRALWAVVMEAYVAGVSTRSVDDLGAALGAEPGISKSEVSRICAGLDETVEAFRSRRLDHTECPYVYLDATYLNVRNSLAQPASMATVVATGVTADGNREVRDVMSATARARVSGSSSWGRCGTGASQGCVWRSLTRTAASQRPPGVTSRARPASGAGCTSSGTCCQWCPAATSTWLPRCSGTIFAQPGAAAVTGAWYQVRDQLAASFPKTGPLMDSAKGDVVAFAASPRPTGRRSGPPTLSSASTRETKRRSRVVAALVAGGYIKLIVTTNFDRLLEAALTDEGIDPTIVSAREHASRAMPIAHSRCTIIKVDGDYLSTDLKNTAEELADCDPSIEGAAG